MGARTPWHITFFVLTVAVFGMTLALWIQYIGWNNALKNVSDEYNDLAVVVANLDCTTSASATPHDNATCYIEFRRLRMPSELQVYLAEVEGTFYASTDAATSETSFYLSLFSLVCVIVQLVLLIYPDGGFKAGEVTIYTVFSLVSIVLTFIGMFQTRSIETTMLTVRLAWGTDEDDVFFPITLWNKCEHIVGGCHIATSFESFAKWYDNTLNAIHAMSTIQYGVGRLIALYVMASICCLAVPVGLLWWRHANQFELFHKATHVGNVEERAGLVSVGAASDSGSSSRSLENKRPGR